MMLHVIQAKYLDGYRVQISFSDGKIGIADLSRNLVGPMFEPLVDIDIFSKLSVDRELDTLVWPNGADIAPEYLYFQAFKEEPELQRQFKEWGYLD